MLQRQPECWSEISWCLCRISGYNCQPCWQGWGNLECSSWATDNGGFELHSLGCHRNTLDTEHEGCSFSMHMLGSVGVMGHVLQGAGPKSPRSPLVQDCGQSQHRLTHRCILPAVLAQTPTAMAATGWSKRPMQGACRSETLSTSHFHNGGPSKSNFYKVITSETRVKILLAHWSDN